MPEVMKTVGRYEILREVGRGGMAMVYLRGRPTWTTSWRSKKLGAFHASDPSFAHRFLRESRVAGSLSHPNIVTVHDYFEHDGTPYITMEYVERGSLRPYVSRMNLAQIGGVLEGLLAADARGSQGIVHRDLKPENLMVTADGRVKIADFGIAKATTKMQTGAFPDRDRNDRGHADLHGARAGDGAGHRGPGRISTPSAAWPSSSSRATCRSMTPTRRWRSCYGTSTSRSSRSRPCGRRSTRGSRTGSRRCWSRNPRRARTERQRRVGRLRGDPAQPARPALASRGAARRRPRSRPTAPSR